MGSPHQSEGRVQVEFLFPQHKREAGISEKEVFGTPRKWNLDLVMESLRGNIRCDQTLICHCILIVQFSKRYVLVCGNPSSSAPALLLEKMEPHVGLGTLWSSFEKGYVLSTLDAKFCKCGPVLWLLIVQVASLKESIGENDETTFFSL